MLARDQGRREVLWLEGGQTVLKKKKGKGIRIRLRLKHMKSYRLSVSFLQDINRTSIKVDLKATVFISYTVRRRRIKLRSTDFLQTFYILYTVSLYFLLVSLYTPFFIALFSINAWPPVVCALSRDVVRWHRA